MMTWSERVIIPVNIELVWNLFNIENLQKIMPEVVETKILEIKNGVVGSSYEQTYREGNRTQKYIVKDLEYENTPEKKHNKSGFTLANLFEIEVSYTLIKLSENETQFDYCGQNKGCGFFCRVLLEISKIKK